MVMDHLQLPNELNFVATVLENWRKWRQIYTCIPWREGLIKKLRNHNPAFYRGAVFNIFQFEESLISRSCRPCLRIVKFTVHEERTLYMRGIRFLEGNKVKVKT